MPLNEQVNIDITAALRQISDLESRLQVLTRPIEVPVELEVPQTDRLRSDITRAEGAVDDLNRELRDTTRELDDVGDEAQRSGRELEQAGRKGEGAFKGLGIALGTVGAGVLAARGLRELAGFLADSVTQASDLEQSIGAVESVFGEASAAIFDFGQTTSQSVGLARSEAFQLSSLIGSQLQTFGFGAAEAAQETQNLIALSADLAATFGGPVSDAVAAVSSLLRGEVNPIERYGVAMNQTLLQAHALEQGIIDVNRPLTLQERTMSALSLLYEQTANAQGQFNRESDTTAGLMERLSAAFQDAQAEIGEALVPAFNALLDSLPGIIDGISALAPLFATLASSVGPLALEFAALVGAIPETEATLSKWAIQSGKAADSADLLAGAIVMTAREIASAEGSMRRTGLEQFTTQLDELLKVAKTSPAELRRLYESVGNLSDFLEPEQIEVIRDAIRDLLAETGQFSSFNESFRIEQMGRPFTDLEEDMRPIPSTLDRTSQAFKDNIAAIDQAIAGASFDLGPLRQEIEENIAALPTAFDAARAAMRDDENEIVEDFGQFLENLRLELASQTEFAENINILRAWGLDDLADQFSRLGPEFGAALADAIENPDSAREAEAELDRYAAEIAAYARQALQRELLEQVTDPFRIPFNVEGILNSINIPGIGQGLIENIQIPGGAGGGVPLPPPGSGGGGGNNLPVGGTNITNNFYSQPQPTTDTERIKQALRTIT